MAARAVLSPAPLRGALVVRAHAGCGKDHAHSAARASKPRTPAADSEDPSPAVKSVFTSLADRRRAFESGGS